MAIHENYMQHPPFCCQNLWILGGGDCRVHVIREDPPQNNYIEVEAGETFPELANKLPSPPLWTNMYYKEKKV